MPLRYCPIQIEFALVNGFTDAIIKRDDNKSDLWNIGGIQCKCDSLTLDNSLDNGYASHFLSGRSLPISFATWGHTNQSTGNDKNFSANIHRALFRMKSVFLILNALETGQYKEANDFFHPIAAKLNDAYGVSDEHSFQLQIGSKTMPGYLMTSVTGTLYQLRKQLITHYIYGRWYR